MSYMNTKGLTRHRDARPIHARPAVDDQGESDGATHEAVGGTNGQPSAGGRNNPDTRTWNVITYSIHIKRVNWKWNCKNMNNNKNEEQLTTHGSNVSNHIGPSAVDVEVHVNGSIDRRMRHPCSYSEWHVKWDKSHMDRTDRLSSRPWRRRWHHKHGPAACWSRGPQQARRMPPRRNSRRRRQTRRYTKRTQVLGWLSSTWYPQKRT